MQIRACHEREYRANAYERVQRVDCLDSVFVIVRVISVPVRVDSEKKKKRLRDIASVVIVIKSSQASKQARKQASKHSFLIGWLLEYSVTLV